ncbi:MAG: SurA N-terminal domain-containing protein [Candidatus Magasanikbacteria bacterium]
MKNKNILISLGVLVVAGIITFLVLGGGSSINKSKKTVATVNGEKVTKAEFLSRYNQLKKTFSSRTKGASLSKGMKDQLKSRTLDRLIGEALIFQEAKEKGFTASSSRVEKRYQQVVSKLGGESALEKRLKKVGVSKKEFKDGIRKQLTVQKYIAAQKKTANLNISEKEIRDFYDRMKKSQKNPPSFEKAKSKIKSQLKRQKESQFISSLVSDLRKKANISTSTISIK